MKVRTGERERETDRRAREGARERGCAHFKLEGVPILSFYLGRSKQWLRSSVNSIVKSIVP